MSARLPDILPLRTDPQHADSFMENWILHYDPNYDAVPWPFAKAWDAFLQSPEPLPFACEDFGRAAPCDSLSETPSVPPHLPRLVPRGRYRFAIYHDAEWLHAFLEVEDGPVIVPPNVLANIPHMKGVNSVHPVLIFLTPDQKSTYRFGLDRDGKPSAAVAPVVYGKRKAEPPKREFQWEFTLIPTAMGRLCCWRIARANIADAFLGDTARFSITHMRFETIEAVAWGSHTTWGPRPDEFGTLRLVEKREKPLWPIARRIELQYDPVTEKGKCRVNWEGIYDKSETDVQVYPAREMIVPWLQWSFRLNGEQKMFDLGASSETGEFLLANGHNHIDIASTGGPAVRIAIEKRSGNRISDTTTMWESPQRADPTPTGGQVGALRRLPHSPVRTRDWLVSEVRKETEESIAISRQQDALGAKRVYRGWECYQASSIGRVYHYLDPDPRLLEVLRSTADYTMTLQRPDGSFGGHHMARYGRPATPWAGGAYDSGQAGELWCVAWWLLKDDKYREASRRLLYAYKDYRVEFNYNFAAFALYHLVTHYRLTRDPLALEHALYYAKNCVAIDLLPLGFHAGHNYYSCYGSITLRGMAMLCQILPGSDPYRAVLREQCIRMTNQVLARQQPDGSFDGCNRFFLDQRFWMWGLFSMPFLLPPDDVARLDAAIQRLLHCETFSHGVGGQTCRISESDLVRYYAHRDDLLAGRSIDLRGLI